MESTPIKRKDNDLRRKSLMHNALKSVQQTASPLRKSVGVTPNRSDGFLEGTNDEEERSRRRNDIAMQKKLSNIQSAESSPASFSRLFGELDLKEHLTTCINLFAENRISMKNVWGIHVIDALAQIVTLNEEQNLLKIASSSLDVGVKVYSLRVDDVHSHVLKLANNLGNVGDKKARDNQEDNDEEMGNDEGNKENEPAKQRKKRKKRLSGSKKAVLDSEGTTIFGNVQKINMVPFSTGEDVQLSAVDNLFTVKLPVHPLAHTIRILDNQKCLIKEDDPTVIQPFKVKIQLPDFKVKRKICPILDDFIVNEWDRETEEKFLAERSKLGLQNDIILDDQGLPIPELDGSIHDIFENGAQDDNDDDEHVEEFVAGHEGILRNEINDMIVDAIPEDGLIETEYGYNHLLKTASGRIIDRIWAGPAHWKLKYIKSNQMKFTGTVIQQQQPNELKRKKAKRIIPTVDFESDVDFELDHKLGSKKTKKGISSNNNKYLLPYSELMFNETMHFLTKPVQLIGRASKGPHQEANVQNYNYDNPNDSQYCCERNSNDNGDNDEDDNDQNDCPMTGDDFRNEDNLCDVPEMVCPLIPKYALHAKKLDMKKLKAATWKYLTKKPDPDNKKAPVVTTKFSQVYKDLPRLLSTQMQNDLSPALVFTSILYLGHEHNLQLISDANLRDFTITNSNQNLINCL